MTSPMFDEKKFISMFVWLLVTFLFLNQACSKLKANNSQFLEILQLTALIIEKFEAPVGNNVCEKWISIESCLIYKWFC